MPRNEVKRYVYLCDGVDKSNKSCPGATVVDAAGEKEADQLAKMRGWAYDSETNRWLCGHNPHRAPQWVRRLEQEAADA